MPLALLLPLTPTAPAPVLGPLGRPANAWFLAQLTRAHPALAATLHEGHGLRPYTVSALLDGRGQPVRGGTWLKEGEEYWLRITTLSDDLAEVVCDRVVHQLPPRLELYKMPFRLNGWTLDPAQHPWAGQISYAEMAQTARHNARTRQVRMAFVTPTAFRMGQADIPLPLPGQIFRSLGARWNAFAPEPMHIHEVWPKFVETCIMVSELTMLNTERWQFAEGTRGTATGFTGTVGFTLLPKQHVGEWAEIWDGAETVMQHLAAFAFYGGVGHHTTVGMGQARQLK